MTIDVNEAVQILATLTAVDPVSGERVPITETQGRSVAVYGPPLGTQVENAAGDEIEHLGEGLYRYIFTPSFPGLHTAVFIASDSTDKIVKESVIFYVNQ